MKAKTATFFESKTNVFLFLLIPTLVLYAKSCWYGFTPLDEKWLITDNAEYLKLWRTIPDSFISSLYHLYYRPLLTISLSLDYKIGGLSTYIYHITNLAWHTCCVLCLFRLLKIYDVPVKTAALLSLIFSLHPIMLHAVAWVPGRNDLMLCAFTLGSLIFLKKYISSPKTKFFVLHLFLFTCALFTKENAVSLPVLFFVIAYGLIVNKNLFRLAIAWFGIVLLWFMLRNIFVPELPGSALSFSERSLNFFAGLFTYTGKSIFPFPQSVHPTYELVSVIIGFAAFILLGFLFFKPGVSNSKTALSGLTLFFILILLPLVYSSGRSNPDFYEHRTYTSICGLILFFSQVKINFNSRITTFILTTILCVFFIKSFMRMNFYKNEETFLSQAIKEQPGYFLFQSQYAGILSDKGNYSLAIEYYNKAIALRPDKAEFYNDRGRAYYELGQYAEAAKDLSSAIKIAGFDVDYYTNRCWAYYGANDIENAMKDLYVLIKCCRETVPNDLKNGVGKEWRAILQSLDTRLNQQPDNDTLLYKRAKLFFDTGQKEKGFADIEKAINIAPNTTEYKKLLIENQK